MSPGTHILIGPDVRIGSEPYAFAPIGLGIVRLWLQSDGGPRVTVYDEAADKESKPFFIGDEKAAFEAARSVLQ